MWKKSISFSELTQEHQDIFQNNFPGLLDFNGIVIIHGHYRSGTSGLTSLISLLKGIPEFLELLDIEHTTERATALKLLKQGQYFCFSVKPSQKHSLPDVFKNGKLPVYNIKLTRTNIIDLLTSSVIIQLDQFDQNYDKRWTKPPYDVSILPNVIRHHISTFLERDKIHQEKDINYNVEVNFESVKDLYRYSNIKESWKPLNYQAIKTSIELEYADMIKKLEYRNNWDTELEQLTLE